MPALCTLVVDKEDDSHWFAMDWFTIWESTDAGSNWTSRVNGMMQLVSFDMGFDPFDHNNLIYGVADLRIMVSHDGGKSFHMPEKQSFAGCNSVAFSTRSRGLAMIAGGKEMSEILRTRDSGRTWERPSMRGLPSIKGGISGGCGVYTVAYDSYRDAFWICVSGKIMPGKGGPYISRDAGESWTWMGNGLPNSIDFYQGSEWGVKLTPQIVFSSDGSGVTGSVCDSRLFSFDEKSGVWLNVDGARYRCPLFQIDLAADPFVPGRFLCGGDIVQESLDGGRTWRQYTPFKGKACCRIAFDASNRESVVFGCNDAILVSNDGGRTLRPLEKGLAYPSGGTRRILLNRNRLYGFTSGSGVFVRKLNECTQKHESNKGINR
jgi:hypothetical protein